ncbi:MAG: PAS domain-containing protein [Acidobacteriia bacterium]|nr:PAS domain-containing protein [Terriglobia bacterium]
MDFYLADSITVFITVGIFAIIFLAFFRRGLREKYFYLWTVGWTLTLLHYLAQVISGVTPNGLPSADFADRLLLSFSVVIFYYSAKELFGLRTRKSLLIALAAVFLFSSYLHIYHHVARPQVLWTSSFHDTVWNYLTLLNSSQLSFLLGGVLFSTGRVFLRGKKKITCVGITVLTYAFLFWGVGFLSLPFIRRWEYYMPLIAQLLNLPKPLVAAGMIIFLFEQERIEAQKHRDEAVEQRDFIQNLMDSAHEAIYVSDRKGRLKWANQECERLLGLTRNVLEAKDLRAYLSPEDLFIVEQAARQVLQGASTTVEVRLMLSNEQTRLLFLSMTPLRDARNEVVGMLSLGRDVTEVKRMEQQLQHAEKLMALGRLIAGAAHELNNPLTTVMGFSELSLQDPHLDPKLKHRFERILQAAARSRRVVEDLQNFVRIPDHKVEAISMNELVTQAMSGMEKDFEAHQIEARRRFSTDAGIVSVDPNRMRFVIQSILKNGVEAIAGVRPRGTITISTQLQGEASVLTITDDGPGIKDPTRIFEPFYSTKEVGKGAGMALSVGRSVVQHYGGKIEAENQPQGGATFRIILPMASPTSASTTSWDGKEVAAY